MQGGGAVHGIPTRVPCPVPCAPTSGALAFTLHGRARPRRRIGLKHGSLPLSVRQNRALRCRGTGVEGDEKRVFAYRGLASPKE